MIGKPHRFHGHKSLNAVYKHGKLVSVSQITLKYLVARPGRKYRIAVVVSRKVSKSAVVRNRIRRRLYEALRTRVATMDKDYDLVLNVYNEQIATMKPPELNNLISELLAKSDVFSDDNATEHAIVNRQREDK